MAIEFRELSDPDDRRFSELLSLYESAIPPSEQKSAEAIRSMASSPRHRVIIAQDNGRVLGFLLIFLGRTIALLEYLATQIDVRSCGLGAQLFHRALAAAEQRILLIEVESDRQPCSDRAIRTRRIGFYKRLGCRRLEDVDFILPLGDTAGVPPIDLLIAHAPDAPVEGSSVAIWIMEIYENVYGCSQDDPRLTRMLAALPDQVSLA